MVYPFQNGLRDMTDTSRKLKILSLVEQVSITEICRRIVSKQFTRTNPKRIKSALDKLEGRT